MTVIWAGGVAVPAGGAIVALSFRGCDVVPPVTMGRASSLGVCERVTRLLAAIIGPVHPKSLPEMGLV